MGPTRSRKRWTASSARWSCSRDGMSASWFGDRPAVVLRVGQLEPLRAELEREVEQLLDAIEVLAVQDAVDRQREVELLRVARGRELLLERPVARDAVVVLGVRALDRDLHVVEPGRLERLRALAREERAGGDERRVQAGVARAGAQLDEIAAQHRLAARERELQDAEPPRLRERADPVLGLELAGGTRSPPMSSGFEQYGQCSGHW